MRARFLARLVLAAACACAAAAAFAQDVVPVPKLTGHVVDLTATLSGPDSAALEAKLTAFERERGSQVAVLLVPTLRGEAIEDFAGRVTDAWQLGRKGVDDGVLFVIAKQDRHMRIHTGRGVQGTLTDALSKRIIADIVTPQFRNGDFRGGIDDGVDAILKAIQGEELPAPAHAQHKEGRSSLGDFLPFALFGVVIVGGILRAMFGRLFGAGITSGVAGVAAWLILGTIAGGIVVALIAFLFTLFIGSGVTQGVRSGGLGGWSGGSAGGWSGGGGGGGFSGGGGGFDGGGASGSW